MHEPPQRGPWSGRRSSTRRSRGATIAGAAVAEIAVQLSLARNTVYLWLHRFEMRGLAGLEDQPREGRPPTYTREQVGEIVATALTAPPALDLPFKPWTQVVDAWPSGRLPERAEGHRHAAQPPQRGVADRRLTLAQAGDLVWRAGGPRLRAEKRAIEALYVAPPAGSVVICRDEIGPEAAKSWPGQRLVVAAPTEEPTLRPAGRVRQEIDYGRRENGYIFGAFHPATGDAFTPPYTGRTIANWVDLLEQVDAWLPAEPARVYAILDHLSTHRAVDVLLFCLAHPRWEFVFQPTYAAYLNVIEPWWKIFRSLARKGHRFETWADICQAVTRATAYWSAHKHPFVWGRRRRHQPRRPPGIALRPAVA